MSLKRNILIEQGATYSNTITLLNANNEPQNVTGWSANGAFKKHFGSANSTAFTVALSNGTLTYSLTANQTANSEASRYVYDIKITDSSGIVTRKQEGLLTITAKVTA